MVSRSDVVKKIDGFIKKLSASLGSEEIKNGWSEENQKFFLEFFKVLRENVEAGRSTEYVGSIGRGMDFRGIEGGGLLEEACEISNDLRNLK